MIKSCYSWSDDSRLMPYSEKVPIQNLTRLVMFPWLVSAPLSPGSLLLYHCCRSGRIFIKGTVPLWFSAKMIPSRSCFITLTRGGKSLEMEKERCKFLKSSSVPVENLAGPKTPLDCCPRRTGLVAPEIENCLQRPAQLLCCETQSARASRRSGANAS